ncbi:MAG: 23S rRNA (guanosine(2251)-2'-O)-methyltransferase RlmB [Pseudomonas fluorescens]|nr:MAG: 23S rRNA (guanosine(2251)-2'-O)-methyltransferase RlmB [Pseudomonas fluorescens]
MVEKRSPKAGFGRGNSAGGDRKPYAKREGGFGDRKPREGGFGGERKSFGDRKPREGGYERKSFGDGERKPYAKREGGFDRKPREGGYERKSFGDGERKPYAKREGGFGERKSSYAPREGGFDRKPREGGYERKSFGDRKPYAPREGGFERKPREGGYERKSFGDGERKPFVKREGGFDRAPREGGYERKSFDRGDSKSAKFSQKPTIKRDRKPREDADTGLLRGDGWLIGYHAVLAALSAGRRKVREVWLLSEAQGELATLLAKNPEWNVSIKAKPDFEKQFGEMVHQGVAALVGNLPQPSLPELLGDKPQLIVALDQITDPHNLGAVVRSAAAFGAKGVLVTEHRAAGLNATAAKVAAGAMEIVPVVEVTNLVQSLVMMQEAGFTVLGMAGEAEEEIGSVVAGIKGPVCLVMGSEGEGLRRLTRETCDKLVKIAINPAMESLNVSVATGVALSILSRK